MQNKNADTVECEFVKQEIDNIDVYLLLGRILFQNGATSIVIITSIEHLKNYLNDKSELHILVEYEAIAITDSNKNYFHTKIDKSRGFETVDVRARQDISTFLRNLPKEKMSISEIREKLLQIDRRPRDISNWGGHTLFAVVALLCGVLNNADPNSWFVIFLSALSISWCKKMLLDKEHNLFVATMLSVFAGELLMCALFAAIPTKTPLVAVMSPTIPLFPGFPLISGGMDVLRNNNSVGTNRIVFALMMIFTIGFSCLAPIMIFANIKEIAYFMPVSNEWLVAVNSFGGGIIAMAVALMCNAPKKTLWSFFLGGFLAHGFKTYSIVFLHADLVMASLYGTLMIAFLAYFISRRYLVNMASFSLICIVSLIPAFIFLNGIYNVILSTRLPLAGAESVSIPLVVLSLQYTINAILIVIAVLAGIIFPAMLVYRKRPSI